MGDITLYIYGTILMQQYPFRDHNWLQNVPAKGH